MKKIILTIIIFFFSILNINAQNITGWWKGDLNVMNQNLELYLHVLIDSDSNYVANLTIPEQSVIDLDAQIKYDNPKLVLEISKYNILIEGVIINNSYMAQYHQNESNIPINFYPSDGPCSDRPQTPKPPYSYNIEEVTFHNAQDNIDLSGTYTYPKTGDDYSAVVMITGSGYQNRDEEIMGHKPFWVIADYLSKNGIAVLRYDDRGFGKSGGTMIGNTSEDFSRDVEAAITFLRKEKGINNVGLCGHSEGGPIAFIVAARNSSKVNFIVSLAGPAIRGDEILLSQQIALAKAAGIPETIYLPANNLNKNLFDILLSSDNNNSELKDSLIYYVDHISTDSIPSREKDKIIAQLTDPWLYYFIKFNPFNDLVKLHLPILVLNGTKDLQVLSNINIPAYNKAFKESGNSKYEIHELKGLNHLFQHADKGSVDEYFTIKETISPEVLDIIEQWINTLD
ncbi:MAG: alpha/beta fold hydrolase [Bacteroidales bacterium]